MGIETYKIQKGDTLTKIAKEHYGLTGNAAYQKALQIAKDNNIANPNLIYAGASLNLLFDDEPEPVNNDPQGQPDAGQPVIENAGNNQEAEVVNKYKELVQKQKAFYQYQDAQEYGTIPDTEFNPETDTTIVFANPEIFETNDIGAKVQAYANAVLKLADQDIEAKDTEDENGEKDGLISLEEFEKDEMAFFEATFAAGNREAAKDKFARLYMDKYKLYPSDAEIEAGAEQIYNELYNEHILNVRNMFHTFDIDGSGYLDRTEIATNYVFMDASLTPTDGSIKLNGDNGEILMALDGKIDLEDSALHVKDNDEAELYESYLEPGQNPVFYTDDRIKEIHNAMFAA